MAPISKRPQLQRPEPPTKHAVISYPAEGVLLVRLNRPKDLNCINTEFTKELERIWMWLDQEPAFAVGIITGTGRAFCAGADLKGKPDRGARASCTTDVDHARTQNGTT
jgi:enoyl-CoA hydratase/carnithine racemase